MPLLRYLRGAYGDTLVAHRITGPVMLPLLLVRLRTMIMSYLGHCAGSHAARAQHFTFAVRVGLAAWRRWRRRWMGLRTYLRHARTHPTTTTTFLTCPLTYPLWRWGRSFLLHALLVDVGR